MPQYDAQAKGGETKAQAQKDRALLCFLPSAYFISFHLRGVKMKSTHASLNAASRLCVCGCVCERVCVCFNPLSIMFDFSQHYGQSFCNGRSVPGVSYNLASAYKKSPKKLNLYIYLYTKGVRGYPVSSCPMRHTFGASIKGCLVA